MTKVLHSVTTAGNACRNILDMSTLVRPGNLSFKISDMLCKDPALDPLAHAVSTCFGNVYMYLLFKRNAKLIVTSQSQDRRLGCHKGLSFNRRLPSDIHNRLLSISVTTKMSSWATLCNYTWLNDEFIIT